VATACQQTGARLSLRQGTSCGYPTASSAARAAAHRIFLSVSHTSILAHRARAKTWLGLSLRFYRLPLSVPSAGSDLRMLPTRGFLRESGPRLFRDGGVVGYCIGHGPGLVTRQAYPAALGFPFGLRRPDDNVPGRFAALPSKCHRWPAVACPYAGTNSGRRTAPRLPSPPEQAHGPRGPG
jgi:hypothetical protein